MSKDQRRMHVIQYLDEGFLAAKASGHSRPDDLSLEAYEKDGLVLLKFSHYLTTDLPLLPGEARQMAETLNELADLIDPPEDE